MYTGLKAGVNEKVAGARCQTRYPEWHNDRFKPFDLATNKLYPS